MSVEMCVRLNLVLIPIKAGISVNGRVKLQYQYFDNTPKCCQNSIIKTLLHCHLLVVTVGETTFCAGMAEDKLNMLMNF